MKLTTPQNAWPTLIGFAGKARSGKDTAVQILGNYGYIRLAFADKVRESLAALNPVVLSSTDKEPRMLLDLLERYTWEDLKSTAYHQHIRTLLQRMGTEVGRNVIGPNTWVDSTLGPETLIHQGKFAVSDVRFSNEAAVIRSLGGLVIHLTRKSHEEAMGGSHPSENIDFECDMYIDNSGTVDDLQSSILDALSGERRGTDT